MKTPAISVIIPMYNAEKYIAECLDSLLIQTFQDFEVIIVDDCSIDNCNAIVEDYKEKFGERLKTYKTETNSGGGGYIPRNIGVNNACGEYIQFLDADDFLLGSALEILYDAAKKYDADVVYTGSCYNMNGPMEVFFRIDGERSRLIKRGLEDNPTLTINDSDKNFNRLLDGHFHTPWTRFVRRTFLIDNKIVFPDIVTGGDFIWVVQVYNYAKRFLRIGTPVCFHRNYNDDSITRAKRPPKEQVAYIASAFIKWIKCFHEFSKKLNVLEKNHDNYYKATLSAFKYRYSLLSEALTSLSSKDVYDILYSKFIQENDSTELTFPLFLSQIVALNEKCLEYENEAVALREFKYYFTSRIDIRLVSKGKSDLKIILLSDDKDGIDFKLIPTHEDDFKIISVSDDKATIKKAHWLPKNEVGYSIQSCEGHLNLVTKTTADGQIRLNLKGLDIRDPKNKSKRVPYWIDYKNLTINGQTIFDTLTPAWHDKSYDYVFDVKAGDEIKIQTEWLPHGSNAPVIVEKKPEKVETKVQPIVEKFLPYLTSRIDVKLTPQGKGDFKIISVSDDKATIKKAHWLPKNEVGYSIQSCEGHLNLVTKTTADGQIRLNLKGLDIRDPKNKSKRVPYWIDYTNLTINGEKIFDNLTPAWHDKSYNYAFDVKAGDEIKIQTEWLPHQSEAPKLEAPKLPPPPPPVVIKDVEPIVEKFLPYLTSRIDVKLTPQGKGDFKIISVSDDKAEVKKPAWLQKDGIGYQIQSHNGKMEIIAKATANGQIQLNLKGLNVRDPEDKSKRVPYWIDYTNLTINGEKIFDNLTPAWHDKSYDYAFDVKAGDEIKIQTEWLPHQSEAPKLPPPPPPVVIKDVEPIVEKFLPYLTSRIDVKLTPQGKGDFKIISVSDDKAEVKKPAWLQKDGIGYQIQSHNGKMEIIAKATANGQIQLNLKGLNVRDPEDKSKRVPYWIDYTNLTINGQTIFNTLTPAWHDESYDYAFEVKAGDEIKIQTEWLPHRSNT